DHLDEIRQETTANDDAEATGQQAWRSSGPGPAMTVTRATTRRPQPQRRPTRAVTTRTGCDTRDEDPLPEQAGPGGTCRAARGAPGVRPGLCPRPGRGPTGRLPLVGADPGVRRVRRGQQPGRRSRGQVVVVETPRSRLRAVPGGSAQRGRLGR